ncbi:MAG: LPS assembly lipoprotein LptE [Salinisphaera sp.]|jgi:LPS-assembly lipoprotein|nr:LPS assembly lipoprotein LptE [Salinisphaera sp.]
MNHKGASRTAGLASWRQRAAALMAVLVLLAVLGGCGFHLQGSSPLPDGVDSMYVSYNDPYRVDTPPLVTRLRERLRRQHLLGETDAPAQLIINHLVNDSRLMSVSPVDSTAVEYEISTQVNFSYRVNGADQLSDQTLTVTRDYSVDQGQRLSVDAEQESLLTSMQKELANLILIRIAEVNHKLVRPDSNAS